MDTFIPCRLFNDTNWFAYIDNKTYTFQLMQIKKKGNDQVKVRTTWGLVSHKDAGRSKGNKLNTMIVLQGTQSTSIHNHLKWNSVNLMSGVEHFDPV